VLQAPIAFQLLGAALLAEAIPVAIIFRSSSVAIGPASAGVPAWKGGCGSYSLIQLKEFVSSSRFETESDCYPDISSIRGHCSRALVHKFP
jgi:hypothetical protein